VVEQPGVDPDRIVLAGWSFGGFLALVPPPSSRGSPPSSPTPGSGFSAMRSSPWCR
jgi:dienelactone hydrolase